MLHINVTALLSLKPVFKQTRRQTYVSILIVEDDMDIAHAIKKHLEAWNLQARCVENFADVMTEFSAYNYHLVLMDITLPFFNGYYWCQEIRKISQIPVLFISLHQTI